MATKKAQKYRWNYPHEWLLEKCEEKAKSDDTAYLLGVINSLIPALDADTIQDSFESEMDADGYFKPTK